MSPPLTPAPLPPLTLLSDPSSVWVALAAVVTQLGDVWFLVLVTAAAYWRGTESLAPAPRRAGASLIAVGLAALALTVGLKSLFALPRPSGAGTATPPSWLPRLLSGFFTDATTADGFGFPSGHALGSTMVYFGAAILYRRFDVARWWIAGAIVTLVSLSRVVLGVHSIGDVVAGVLFGAVGLAGFVRVLGTGPHPTTSPDRGFLAAGALACVAVLIAVVRGYTTEVTQATLSLGASIGGLLGWRLVPTQSSVGPLRGLVGGVLVAAGFGAAVAIGTGPLPDGLRTVRPILAGVAGMLAGWLLVAWPAIEERWSA